MADRSHLVPAVITDRTGKTTTVYRRPLPGAAPRLAGKVPSPEVAAEQYTGRERLTGILNDIADGQPLSPRALDLLSQCTEEQARIIADAHEAHPGYGVILTAQTTLPALLGHEATASPSLTAAVARMYEEGAVSTSGFDPQWRAVVFHQLYSIAVTNVGRTANRVGLPEASPLADEFNPKHLDAARECVRVWSALRVDGRSITGSEDIFAAAIRGECTGAGAEAAISEHGATDAREIIALAKGIAPSVSGGWL